MDGVKQLSLGECGFKRKTVRTLKRDFVDEMNLAVPWAELLSLIAPHAPAHDTMTYRALCKRTIHRRPEPACPKTQCQHQQCKLIQLTNQLSDSG